MRPFEQGGRPKIPRPNVKVEAPGVDEKDLKITFEDGLLTVTGERQFERKEDRNYHRIERAYGSFNEEAKPKQIAINVNQKQLNA